MEIRYVGPFDEVEIADTGQVVAQGETVDVVDDVATALLEQPDNWQPVKGNKAKPSADTSTNEEQ